MTQALHLSVHQVSHFAEEGAWASVEGRVDSLPLIKEKGKRRVHSFVLEARNLFQSGKLFETTGKVQVFLFNPAETAPFGSRVRIRGKLLRAKTPRNPGEFDYRKFLQDQGIHVVMEGYGERSIRILSGPAKALTPVALIQKLREASSRRLDSLFQSPVNQLLKALILGIRKDLPEEIRDDFVKTGTAHLVAISGMNITLVAGSLFLFALVLGLPQKGAAMAGLLAAVGYVFVSGAGIPVVRAGWMAGLFFTGVLLEREKDFLNSLFFAFFIILAFDPRALFQAGFQLSFLSVLSLVLFTSKDEARGEWLQTLTVLAGTFPLCILYFNVFSWTSIAANALAIPFFNLGVLGGLGALLAGKLPLIGWIFTTGASAVLNAGMVWIHFWAEKSWGYVYLKSPSALFIFLYYAAIVLWLVPKKMPKRYSFLRPFALSIGLMALGGFFLPVKNSCFSLTFLAAGQNEIFHIVFPGNEHWLVNAGRARPSNQARWIVGPYLRREGLKQLKGVLLTDFSTRHTGSLETLLENFSVASLGIPPSLVPPKDMKQLLDSRKLKRLRTFPLETGERAGFEILKETTAGVFLFIHYRGFRFLFVPTWNHEAIEEALETSGESFVDVLILPGTGRPDSADWENLLAHFFPAHVVMASEKPALQPVLDSLEREEIPHFSIAQTGALRFQIQDGRLQVQPFLSRSSV